MNFPSSRERLDMNIRDKENRDESIAGSRRKGWYVETKTVVIVIILFLLAIFIVGLLVGYLAPKCETTERDDNRTSSKLEKKTYPYVLLPSSVVPIHYQVELQPFLIPDNFTFDGSVQITVLCTQSTENITVQIKDLTIHHNSIQLRRGRGGSNPKIEKISYDETREFLILHLDSSLESQEQYEVAMKFRGNLNDKLVGFYRSSYRDSTGKTRWLATTQFQATYARRAFPCFDEPRFKATFQIVLVRWKNMTSLSNMPINRTVVRDDDWVADIYQTTVRMSTYLLAFVVSDFKSKSNAAGDFRVWAHPEIVDTLNYSLQLGERILKHYEGYFNIKYPLPKTDLVAVPDFGAGAMENWGIVIFRERYLSYDKKLSSGRNKQNVARIIAHELAHQWFGNLVTPEWWDDLWLNEGFASYVEYLGTKAVEKDWKMDEQFIVSTLQPVLVLDSLKTSHPISVPVNHPDEIAEIFDGISYSKGASIIRMMNHFLGEENFRTGLTKYLIDRSYKNAVQDDLWKHLTMVQKVDKEEDRINVKTVMDSWTLQTGYPLLTVIRDYKQGIATITQNRFLLENQGNNTISDTKWEVPVTYTDSKEKNWQDTTPRLWLHKTNGQLENLVGPDHWLVVNVQEVGYYRVNYDTHNWQLLINQLVQDHKAIHVINRAQIINDAMNLARVRVVPYTLALNTTLYLNNEKEYIPWAAVLGSFSYLNSMLCRSSVYGKWKKYVKKQIHSMYKELGWDEKQDDDLLTQYNRINVLSWACSMDHPDCIASAREIFQRWMEDPDNKTIISPNMRSLVYCTGVKHGGEEEWDTLWKQYLVEENPIEKNKQLRALACTRELWILSRLLDWTIAEDSQIRHQDGFSVITAVAQNIFGREMCFSFLRNKWDTLRKIYGLSIGSWNYLVKSVFSSFNTPFERKQIKDFYVKNEDNIGPANRAFLQSIEEVEANVQWMRDNFDDIKNWLKRVV
ncbi:aminopeptidase N-like [Tachypleus tridentatus]|uniref:aminopeptidase N-like n=1 Tax=Tachypleus tridentatus TaxID=6853 RepID=UPI003FD4C8E8